MIIALYYFSFNFKLNRQSVHNPREPKCESRAPLTPMIDTNRKGFNRRFT